jgi:high-affinity nickel permease
MVAFDSTTVSNIFLGCIALTNIVTMAILYERFSKKRVIIISKKSDHIKKDINEKP